MTAAGPDGGWARCLDALEQAVLALDTAVLSGRSPARVDVSLPAEPVPDRLRERAAVLLALLHDVTERTRLQRDYVAAELAAMPAGRPVDHARSGWLGSRLDVLT